MATRVVRSRLAPYEDVIRHLNDHDDVKGRWIIGGSFALKCAQEYRQDDRLEPRYKYLTSVLSLLSLPWRQWRYWGHDGRPWEPADIDILIQLPHDLVGAPADDIFRFAYSLVPRPLYRLEKVAFRTPQRRAGDEDFHDKIACVATLVPPSNDLLPVQFVICDDMARVHYHADIGASISKDGADGFAIIEPSCPYAIRTCAARRKKYEDRGFTVFASMF